DLLLFDIDDVNRWHFSPAHLLLLGSGQGFDRPLNGNDAGTGSRNAAIHQQDAVFGVDTDHADVLNGDPLMPHVTRHFLVLEALPGIGAITDRAERTVRKGCAVGLETASHVEA